MGIIRVQKDTGYFVASNEPFNDECLSWEARGLLGYLLSKPNDWKIRTEDLIKHGKAGQYKISRMLAELKKAGYMRRTLIQVQGTRQFDWITDIYETKASNPYKPKSTSKAESEYIPLTKSGAIPRKPINGSPIHGKPRHIVNTDLLNTESTPKETASGEQRRFVRQYTWEQVRPAFDRSNDRVTNMPAYADVFHNVSSLVPPSNKIAFWRKTFTEWERMGVQGYDIVEAYGKSRSHGNQKGFLVSSPESLTNTLAAIVAETKQADKLDKQKQDAGLLVGDIDYTPA